MNEEPSMCFLADDKVHIGAVVDDTIESFCNKQYMVGQIGQEITFIGGYKFLSDLGVGPQSNKVDWCRLCWRSFAKSLFS